MRLQIKRDRLYKALQLTTGVISTKNSLPILSNILLRVADGYLQLSATDLQVSISQKIKVEDYTEGSLAVDARKFFGIVRELGSYSVELSASDTYLQIVCGRSSFKLPFLAAENFPSFAEFSENPLFSIKALALQKMLKRTAIAVLHDQINKVLCGVNMVIDGGKLLMMASDKHRLAIDELTISRSEGGDPESFVLPTKAIDELIKILGDMVKGDDDKVVIFSQASQLLFKLSDTILITRLIDGKYPDFPRLIPQEDYKEVLIDRISLLAAIKRVSLLANENTHAIKMGFSDDVLTVSAKNINTGEAKEEVSCPYQGDELVLGYNYRYAMDVLNVLSCDTIVFKYSRPLSPAIIEVDGEDNYKYVIMPMKI